MHVRKMFASIGSFGGLFRMDMNLNVAWELNCLFWPAGGVFS